MSAFAPAMLATPAVAIEATTTWNGAVSHAASGEALTDLFYAAARGLERDRLETLLNAAWHADPLLTLRMIAYIRQVRGGKGERDLGRWSLHWLAAKSHRDLTHNLAHYVGTFGRWDDLVGLVKCEHIHSEVLDCVARQLRADLETLDRGEASVSLAAKWVPSEGGRDDRQTGFSGHLARHMAVSRKELRQTLVRLRKAVGILESHLVEGTLDRVDYSKLPSVAMNRHGKAGKAFERRDGERFAEYKAALTRGEATVNTGALFPHQIVEKYLARAGSYGGGTAVADELTEAQWKSMLERLSPEERSYLGRTLVVADTSGSMYGSYGAKTTTQPITVAISLGLLVCQMNPNPAFQDLVLTFNTTPEFHRVTGTTLAERVNSLKSSHWGGSTDFGATFRLILNKAREFRLAPSEMPETLLVVSDMQFNQAGNLTNYESLRQAYTEAGYRIPKLVFWNVNGSTTDFPVSSTQTDTAMVSGFSVDILRDVLKGEDITPFRVMMRVLERPEYGVITRGHAAPLEPPAI